MPRTNDSTATRTRLLDAARDVIRAKGYTATTVDDICAAAGVTKGGFFHDFDSKERLGIAAAEHFNAMAAAPLLRRPTGALPDPRDPCWAMSISAPRCSGRDIAQYTCLLGTLVQEVYATHPEIRATCEREMSATSPTWCATSRRQRIATPPTRPWSPESVGYFMQTVLQGAFIFAKAKQSPAVAADSLGHLRRYLETLLGHPHPTIIRRETTP